MGNWNPIVSKKKTRHKFCLKHSMFPLCLLAFSMSSHYTHLDVWIPFFTHLFSHHLKLMFLIRYKWSDHWLWWSCVIQWQYIRGLRIASFNSSTWTHRTSINWLFCTYINWTRIFIHNQSSKKNCHRNERENLFCCFSF